LGKQEGGQECPPFYIGEINKDMSTFAVTVERIDNIRVHENADRLEMASLAGKDYDFVVAKGQFQTGDKVVYFPVDSLLPMPLVQALGLEGRLAHGFVPEDGSPRLQNRVKTVKLRGNLSQGIVASFAQLSTVMPDLTETSFEVGENLTDQVGVVKYEPPVVPAQYGNLVSLPDLVSVYDIESAQNYTDIVDSLMDTDVFISEKLEGSNWWATINANGEVCVGQRNYAIEPVESGEHDWHKVMRTQNLKEALIALWTMFADRNPQLVTLRGEMIGVGIQGNYYKLKDQKVYVFDIEVNGKPVNSKTFLDVTEQLGVLRVPVLSVGSTLRTWLGGQSIKAASDGISQLADRAREGIVIKPMIEDYNAQIGRVFIKQRSPEYLAKSEL
jgi:RNA ligase (TIGR02306 family)